MIDFRFALICTAAILVLSGCGKDPGKPLYGRWKPEATAGGQAASLFFEPNTMGYEVEAPAMPGGAKNMVLRFFVEIETGTIQVKRQNTRILFRYADGSTREEDGDPTVLSTIKPGAVLEYHFEEEHLVLTDEKGTRISYTRSQ